LKIAVIGSRKADPIKICSILNQLPAGCSEIVSGGARGVAQAAKKSAKKLGVKFTSVRPNYRKYGKVAPLIRNLSIIDSSDCVLAIWDGKSKGTRQAIVCCIKKRKPFKIILIDSQKIFQNR
jgi:hypothetical protein